MSIWKTLKQEKPERFESVIVVTKDDKIARCFYNPEDKSFYTLLGLCYKVKHKLWCRETDLVNQALNK